MKSVNQHNRFLRLFLSSLTFILLFTAQLSAQDIDPEVVKKGKKIYNANCASCHKLEGVLIGPALGNVEERRTNEWLKAWIKDNAAFRATGDADAIAIFNEYNGSVMTAFPQLSDGDIDAILAYTSYPELASPAPPQETTVSTVPVDAGTPTWILWVLGAILFLAIVVILNLIRIIRELKGAPKTSRIDEDLKGLWGGIKDNVFLHVVATIFLLISGAYLAYSLLSSVGIDQGYQPIQPIAFSHKIHAGENKVDCQYCHSSAKHSKHSGIPSLNVCMNCHKSIAEVAETTKVEAGGEILGKKELDLEIQKLYDAIGWDKDEFAYIENYEQKPIKWVRLHNLPDFAYFNHSQHVTAGGLKCQQCHGPVEEMDEMYQYSPLTMGWCINCHRETEIDMKGNEYYTKIHEELSKKYGVEKVTVAQMGGLECGKCHY